MIYERLVPIDTFGCSQGRVSTHRIDFAACFGWRASKAKAPAGRCRSKAGRANKQNWFLFRAKSAFRKFHFGHFGADSDQSKTSVGAPVGLWESCEILNGKWIGEIGEWISGLAVDQTTLRLCLQLQLLDDERKTPMPDSFVELSLATSRLESLYANVDFMAQRSA